MSSTSLSICVNEFELNGKTNAITGCWTETWGKSRKVRKSEYALKDGKGKRERARTAPRPLGKEIPSLVHFWSDGCTNDK